MPDIDELIAEVLRLDAEGTPGPWDSEKWIDAGDTTAYGVGRRDEPRPVVWSEHPGWDAATCDADEELIGYYRTAAPVLAREVQRLQAEVDRLRGPHRHCYQCLEDLPQGATDDCCDGCRDQLRRDEEAE
jgi:hypothetical protein